MPNIGFTGTQHGMTKAQKHTLFEWLTLSSGALFHHGDCIGADKEAHDIAKNQGLLIVLHPPINPDKRAWCKALQERTPKPYLDRNKDIVDESDYLLATPGEDTMQLRSGTWSTVRYAKRNNKTVYIIKLNGDLQYG